MPKATLLIVEDEAIVAEDLAQKLARLGYEIRGITALGEEAVALAREQRPDLVLMDIRLKGRMDGVEAAELIRRECDLPVIYLTAHSDRATLERAKLTEPFGYVLKPFEELELETHVEMALYKHEAERDRKQADEALRAQSALLNLAHDAILVRGPGDKITFWNQGAERTYGWTQEEALGRVAHELLKARFPNPLVELNADMAEKGGWEGELFHTRKDGQEIVVASRWAAQRNLAGHQVAVMEVNRDITERKQAIEALAQSERRYRAFFEQNLDAVFSTDLTGRFEEINPAAERLSGYSIAELRQLIFEELCAPDQLQATIECFQAAIRGDFRNVETAFIRKDGQRVELFLIGSPIRAGGQLTGFFVIARDITESKRTERQLRELSQRLAYHVDHSPLAVIEWGPDMRLCRWSGEAERVFGWKAEEVLGRQMEDFHWIHSEDAVQVAEVAADLQSGKNPRRFSANRNYRKDGSIVHCEWYNSALLDESGKLRSLLSLVLDVTERKKAEEALAAAREELRRHAEDLETTVQERTAKLRELVGELEHFSYTITHDMRAPLRAMRGFAQIMIEDGCVDCDRAISKDFLGRIMESAKRMDTLIIDALQYSRAVQTELKLARVEIAPLLRGIVGSYPNLQPPNASITLEGDFPPVLGNEAALTQCFANLLGNAVKFIEPGKLPQVRVWAEEVQSSDPRSPLPLGPPSPLNPFPFQSAAEEEMALPPISVSSVVANPAAAGSEHSAATVRIWFEDNGIGIPKDQQERIFAMFHRVANAYEGSGIGLALVRKNIERMSGRIGVESEPGKGSRFWIDIQAAKE